MVVHVDVGLVLCFLDMYGWICSHCEWIYVETAFVAEIRFICDIV